MGFITSDVYYTNAVVPSTGVTTDVPVIIGASLIVPAQTVDYDATDTSATFRGYMSGRLLGASSDTSVFAVGDAAYWDIANSCVTATATGNRLMGVALSAKGSADTTVDVRVEPLVITD